MLEAAGTLTGPVLAEERLREGAPAIGEGCRTAQASCKGQSKFIKINQLSFVASLTFHQIHCRHDTKASTQNMRTHGERKRGDEANDDRRKRNLWLTHGFMIGRNLLDITGRT
jgi:hypothetical protein